MALLGWDIRAPSHNLPAPVGGTRFGLQHGILWLWILWNRTENGMEWDCHVPSGLAQISNLNGSRHERYATSSLNMVLLLPPSALLKSWYWPTVFPAQDRSWHSWYGIMYDCGVLCRLHYSRRGGCVRVCVYVWVCEVLDILWKDHHCGQLWYVSCVNSSLWIRTPYMGDPRARRKGGWDTGSKRKEKKKTDKYRPPHSAPPPQRPQPNQWNKTDA